MIGSAGFVMAPLLAEEPWLVNPRRAIILSMSVLTSLGILTLALFACGFLRLVPNIFAIFYHYASAKNSRDNTLKLSGFFVVGHMMMTMVILFLIYFILYHFLLDNPLLNVNIFYWVIAGILALLSLFLFFFYYRRGKGTRLFLGRKLAKNISLRARNASKKPSDVFALGMTAGIFELIFVLPVYVVVILEIINFESDNILYQPLLFFTFVILSMASTFAMRGQFYRKRKNLAEIHRAQVKNRTFYRIMLSASFLLLAVFIVSFRIFS